MIGKSARSVVLRPGMIGAVHSRLRSALRYTGDFSVR
ncbi:MAG: hypothetical protein AVDCRST_MAG28-238 [uncultured Rubrobacteraceae bacterium]|uniref:Uncharacterized protein n=1 Tax=uncultured Rubrobacteraceae bacterium TaxID=349277 RepID=A0A6J4QHP2_9ACTN|nr:MAG: hypothetical protein AVDCRST_MAG28-238 [uncultured Rubrobacteraceae bacterium]